MNEKKREKSVVREKKYKLNYKGCHFLLNVPSNGDLVTLADGLFQCLVLFERKEYINF